MIVIGIRFRAGRFHATPWDHHVNEGVPEWPPSPWRILRGLVASMHTPEPGLDREAALEAIMTLAGTLPAFHLPAASVGHTRHYLSLNQLERTKTTMTFDTFVALDPEAEVFASWDVDMGAPQRTALESLLGGVTYLGRAESWCDLTLRVPAEPPNCIVSDGTALQGHETVRVLCASPQVRLEDLERATTSLQREGWSDPPGTRWVFYRRPADALRARVARAIRARRTPVATVSELALGGKVLPLYVDALRVTEAVRRAALQLHGEPSEVLAGKDAEGQPLRDQHRHAHYVADCRGPVGRVSHVLVWAPAGLSATEQDALARLLFLHAGERGFSGEERSRGDDPRSVDVVPMGFGQASDFAGASRLFMRARRWRSRTPFVLPRHPKRGRESADEQLVRELATRGFPRPESVRRVDGAALRDPLAGKASLTRWVEFEVRRRNRRPTTPVVGFELLFAEPQQGPILLGWGSHYGLGAFEAVE